MTGEDYSFGWIVQSENVMYDMCLPLFIPTI